MTTPSQAEQLDLLARAIADPTRRRILERLAREPGATTGELAALAPGLTRFATIKHLEVLRQAGLLRTMSEGRRRRHYAETAALGPLREWLAGR
ncbi:MAG TPA: helix-turn-helix domain-containing protein [Candidatus Limnocylindrales bacterium]|nr:helix-turn-helix domain-containing protein [Candidatus Limnocylindrales bacterium]